MRGEAHAVLSLTLDELYPNARYVVCKFRKGVFECVRKHYRTEGEAHRAAILANRMSLDPTVTFHTVLVARGGETQTQTQTARRP